MSEECLKIFVTSETETTATVIITLNNLSEIDNFNMQLSDIFYTDFIPWKIVYESYQFDNEKYIGIYLQYQNHENSFTACFANVNIYPLFMNPTNCPENLKISYSHFFCKDKQDYGSRFKLTDLNDFICNNQVFFKVIICPEIRGVKRKFSF